MIKLSAFGRRFTRESAIRQLMDDFGESLHSNEPVYMLGGGNPAHIPEVEAILRARMETIFGEPGAFAGLVGAYGPPGGDPPFRTALAELLERQFGWQIAAENVAITTGSQGSFFSLFNLLAGEFNDGGPRKIMLPLTPEYVGYADVGLSDDFFLAKRPVIKHLDGHFFKYHVDFSTLEIGEEVGAICVSRPTNPTGNVVTDDEVQRLSQLARSHDVPLILDNAYGTPFPNIIFTDVEPLWEEHIILCMSLSKLGLPGTRTGIVIARPEIIDAVTNLNAIFNLAPSGFGTSLAYDLVASGEIIEISRKLVTPFYRCKVDAAVECLHQALQGLDYYIHQPEGAIFLWLWFPGLPISSRELYARLRVRGVFVLAGEYFFPGLSEPADVWPHKYECIRINYAQPDSTVTKGIQILGEEVKKLF